MRKAVAALVISSSIACSRSPEPTPQPPARLSPTELRLVRDLIQQRREAFASDRRNLNAAVASARARRTTKTPCSGDFSGALPKREPLKPIDYADVMRRVRVVLASDAAMAGDAPSDPAFEFEAKAFEEKVARPLENGETSASMVESAKEKFGPPELPLRELVLVAYTFIEPKLAGETDFTPGTLEGRLYLFDRKDRRMMCAADVDAKSTDYVLSVRRNSPVRDLLESGDLKADLVLAALEQAVPHLRRLEVGTSNDYRAKR